MPPMVHRPENIKRRGSCTDLRSCTHHRQCEDIGTVKLPRMLKQFTQKDLQFTFTSGTDFPSDLSPYQVIIHCGGCTLTEKEMQYRIRLRQRTGHSNYELWNCHCVYAGDFREKYGVILKNRGNLPLNKLKVSFV